MEQPMQSLRPLVPAPPLMGEPPPTYAYGLHNGVADIHSLLDAWSDFLSSFSPQYLTDAEGNRREVLARTRFHKRQASTEWFAVTDITADGVFKVRVNQGRIACPNIDGHDSASPSITKYLRMLTVAEKELTVTDGSLIYCKITATKEPANYPNAGEDAGGIITVTVNMKSFTWRATAGEITVEASEQEGNSTTAYILLAEIDITDGVVKVIPRHRGLITAPAFTAAYQEDPTVVTETESYTVCVEGTPVSATFIAVQAT